MILTELRLWKRRDAKRFIPFGIVTSRLPFQSCITVRLFGRKSTSRWHVKFWALADLESIQHCIQRGVMTSQDFTDALMRHEHRDLTNGERHGWIQPSNPTGQPDTQP